MSGAFNPSARKFVQSPQMDDNFPAAVVHPSLSEKQQAYGCENSGANLHPPALLLWNQVVCHAQHSATLTVPIFDFDLARIPLLTPFRYTCELLNS